MDEGKVLVVGGVCGMYWGMFAILGGWMDLRVKYDCRVSQGRTDSWSVKEQALIHSRTLLYTLIHFVGLYVGYLHSRAWRARHRHLRSLTFWQSSRELGPYPPPDSKHGESA